MEQTAILNEAYSKELNEFCNKSNQSIKVTELTPATRQQLIHSCLKLAYSVAKKYHTTSGTKMDIDDVAQAANEGLVIAANRYNDVAVKFSAYAFFWIKKYTLDCINVTARPLAVSTSEGYRRVTDSLSFLSKDAKFATSDDDIEGDKNPVYKMLVSSYISGESMADLDNVHNKQTNMIYEMFDSLDRMERLVIAARFGFMPFSEELSVNEIGSRFGISKNHIEKTIQNAFTNIRNYCETNELDIEEILDDAKSISAHSHLTEDIKPLIDMPHPGESIHKWYKKQPTETVNETEFMSALRKASGLTEVDLETALFKDDNGSYAFYAKRHIANLIVYKKFQVVRRYANGSAKIDISYTVFNNNECVKQTTYIETYKRVSMHLFESFCERHGINQMHMPQI